MPISMTKLRAARKKAKAWLGTYVWHITQEPTDHYVFSKRLHPILESLVNDPSLQQAVKVSVSEPRSHPTDDDLKTRIHKKLTPKKMLTLISTIQDATSSRAIGRDDTALTIGELVENWATLTDQNHADFAARVYSKIVRLIREWQKSTGQSSFTDLEIQAHSADAAKFMSHFYRLLLEETPHANIDALLSKVLLLPEKESCDDFLTHAKQLLPGVSTLFTLRIGRQISRAIEVNPKAKTLLSAPELAALIEWEEEKHGWGGSTTKAVKILKESALLRSDSSNQPPDDRTILYVLKLVGRQSLVTNINDAVKNKLVVRYKVAIDLALQKLSRQVRSVWEFATTPRNQKTSNNVLQWIFRR